MIEGSIQDRNVEEGDPLRYTEGQWREIGSSLRWDLRLQKADPTVKVKWILNGEELKPSPDCQIMDGGDGSYRCVIPSAKSAMNGKLKVRREKGKKEDTYD